MAKNNNLTDFLTGVADAIRTKKGTSGLINPQDFESEISNIRTEKPEQEKSVSISTNGTTEVTPDTGKALSKVTVTTNVQPTLQEKTVAPTTTQQIVTADSGKDGLSKVTVEAVTSSIDSNIVPENIKKDVTILGVTGTLESLPALTDGYVVRWEREDQLYEITNVKQGNAVNAPATSPVVGQTINWYDYYHKITFPYTPSADVVLTAYTDTEFNNTYYVWSNYSHCAVQTQMMFEAWFNYVNNGHADDGTFSRLVSGYIGALPLSFLLTSVGESYNSQLSRFMQYVSQQDIFTMKQLDQITGCTQQIISIIGADTAPSVTYIDKVKDLLTRAYAILGIQLIQSGTSVLLLDSSKGRTLLKFTGLLETLYDFSQHTSVPTLSNTNAFKGINGICKIIVPDSLYDSWITATNWSTYADYIYKVSEVNGGGAGN